MVLSNQVLSIDPGVVLFVELCAILALAEEDLATAGMDFGVLCDIVDNAFVNGPAVILSCVLSDLLSRVERLGSS